MGQQTHPRLRAFGPPFRGEYSHHLRDTTIKAFVLRLTEIDENGKGKTTLGSSRSSMTDCMTG